MDIHALVVDDDRASAQAIAQLLRQSGCIVTVSTQPLHAVELALAPQVDLVCLDIAMPELSGFEVLSLIRSHEYTRRSPNVPVMAITGHVSDDDRAASIAAGFAAHVNKPVTPESLDSGIATVAALRDALCRTRHSCDQEAILARIAQLQGREPAGPAHAVAGLALALEQQGAAHLGATLRLAYAGADDEALHSCARLAQAAEALDAHHLAGLCHELAGSVGLGAARFEPAAVLVRAELDRVVSSLREGALAPGRLN